MRFLSSAKGAIAFQSVNFGYAGDRHVLRDINLRIDRIRSLAWWAALVRAKALMSLVPRFAILPGLVMVDDVNVRRSQKKFARTDRDRLTGYVAFLDRYAREHRMQPADATEEEIIEAARRARRNNLFGRC
jgi:ABC-type transport system involved in Fe-S cluster assembly fused permease/ATPase subunit